MSSLETNRLLQDKTLNDDARTCATSQLRNLGISGLMTLEAIEFQTFDFDAVLVSCKQLQDSYAPRLAALPPELHACFQGSAKSTEQIATLVQLVQSAPQALWSLRDDSFNRYDMDFRLAELQQYLAVLKPLNKKLAPFVNPHSLDSEDALRAMQHCLNNAGVFRWFSAKWRRAKQQALTLGTNEQLKLDDMQQLFPAMIKYVTTQKCFDDLFVQAPILSTCHHGLNTDVAPLLAVREWYKDVAFAMTEHFVGEAGFLQGLSVMDKQNADKLVTDYNESLALIINNIDKKINKLRLCFPGCQTLQQNEVDYVTAVTELKTIVVNALSVLKDNGVNNNTCLSEL